MWDLLFHYLQLNSEVGERMTNKQFKIIWNFCDWLSYQGLAYETLYYGGTNDIENLIKRYLEDEEWANKKESGLE